MIRSMRTVLTRCLLGVLADRKISVFQVAEAVSLPVTDLKRLVEFASPLDPEASRAAGRLGHAHGCRVAAEVTGAGQPCQCGGIAMTQTRPQARDRFAVVDGSGPADDANYERTLCPRGGP